MKTSLLILLVALYTLPSLSQSNKNFIDQPYIEVSGEGEMEVVPNEFYLSISIRELDNKGRKALEELENKMINKLESIGINTKTELSVSDFVSNFRRKVIGQDIYTAKSYQLKLTQTAIVPLVFEALESLGISNIDLARLDHSEIDQFKKEVKIKAVQNAKEKAGYLLESLDQQVGKAIYIQELSYGYRGYEPEMDMMLSRSASSPKSYQGADLDFNTIKLEYKILVRFAIE